MEVSLELNKLMPPQPKNSFLRYRVNSARVLPHQRPVPGELTSNHFVRNDVFERVRSNKQLLNKITSMSGTAPLRMKLDKPAERVPSKQQNRYAETDQSDSQPLNKTSARTGITYKPRKRVYTDHSYYQLKFDASQRNIKAGRELYLDMMGIMRGKVHDWLAD